MVFRLRKSGCRWWCRSPVEGCRLSAVDCIGTAFVDLEDRLAPQAGGLDGGGGAARGEEFEAELRETCGRLPHGLGLSRSLTLMKMVPLSGSGVPALNCALTNASPKFSPTPMTSPVERISGPSAGSTPGNLLNGKTGLLTNIQTAPAGRPRCSVDFVQLLAQHQAARPFWAAALRWLC